MTDTIMKVTTKHGNDNNMSDKKRTNLQSIIQDEDKVTQGNENKTTKNDGKLEKTEEKDDKQIMTKNKNRTELKQKQNMTEKKQN